MDFIVTTAIKRLLKMAKRIKIVPGGTSAGKTFGIIPILINKAIVTAGLEISIVSESVPHLRKGALKDFLKIMKATGRYRDECYNRSFLIYTFPNGSYIEFFSADQEDKVRGPRRNILYINECNNVLFETYHQLAIRTDLEVWLDFNPTAEFWVHTELNADEDAETLVLTYTDNEALAQSIVKEIEKARAKAFFDISLDREVLFSEHNIKSPYWANWWRVYGLGVTGALDGLVYQNWAQVHKVPLDAVLLGYGLDFGFTNDPTAMVAIYRWNGKLIIQELIYKTGLLNKDIIREMMMANVDKNKIIWADSAEPKTIEEIRRAGFNIEPVKKGPDSIIFGVSVLQEFQMLITADSVSTIKELRGYIWDTNKTGKKLNVPVDYDNHSMDALRYFAMSELKRKSKTWVLT
jgi:phage terminase large subunit